MQASHEDQAQERGHLILKTIGWPGADLDHHPHGEIRAKSPLGSFPLLDTATPLVAAPGDHI